MKILDYLDKLTIRKTTFSQIICVCPKCHGDNLKISKSNQSYGAYKCWDGCSTEEIREALGILSIVTPTHKLPPIEKTYITNLPQINPIPFTSKSFCSLAQHSEIIPTIKYRLSQQHAEVVRVSRRIYPYSSTQRLLRWDIEGTNFREKRPCIQTQNMFGEWVNGIHGGNTSWPVYTGFSKPKDDGDTIIFVEGEKTAEFVKTELNIFAVTLSAMTFNSSETQIALALRLFFTQFPFIKNIIYIPDTDAPGKIKAEKLQKPVWINKRGYRICPLSSFLPPHEILAKGQEKGLDLADFSPSIINLFNLLS